MLIPQPQTQFKEIHISDIFHFEAMPKLIQAIKWATLQELQKLTWAVGIPL